MPICEYCGKNDPYARPCHYCGKVVCSEHLLPENHGCMGIYGGKKIFDSFKVTTNKNNKPITYPEKFNKTDFTPKPKKKKNNRIINKIKEYLEDRLYKKKK